MPIRFALRVMFIALALLPATGALIAYADDGPPQTPDVAGHPPHTVLRPVAPQPRRELVLLVSGIASDPSDATFAALARSFVGDSLYAVARFGADPRHPYDTSGPLDSSARELIREIRERRAEFDAVHLVTHSMGGVVVDRAFEQGLSAHDGVRTFVALAPPHDRPALARTAVSTLALAEADAPIIRAALSIVRDPGLPAIADLATHRPYAAPASIVRLDLRLATDQVVTSRDAFVAGVDSRILLPTRLDGIQGHGAVLRDPRVLDAVQTTVRTGVPPRDERSSGERFLTDVAAGLADRGAEMTLLVVSGALLGLIMLLRSSPLRSRVHLRPLAERVLARR